MSELPPRRLRRGFTSSLPGQSFVEFALVLPMLLVLLLGIADFGRVFQAGIILEAATRNSAEAAAQELVQLRRNKTTLAATDYANLHALAIDVACAEASKLDEAASCALDGVAVCVHDDKPGEGTSCGSEAAAAPKECTQMFEPWTSGIESGSGTLPYVEVRACYRFTTIFNLSSLQLPFGWGLTLGDVWLERDRSFVAGDYQ